MSQSTSETELRGLVGAWGGEVSWARDPALGNPVHHITTLVSQSNLPIQDICVPLLREGPLPAHGSATIEE